MATVHEVLKASGLSDEQIASLDKKYIDAFNGVLTTAEAEKKAGKDAVTQAEAERKSAAENLAKAQAEYEAAKKAKEEIELVQRSNSQWYEEKVVPALTGWEQQQKKLETEKANALAEVAFYKTQIEGAKTAGFLPSEAPGFVLPAGVNAPAADPARDSNGRFVANAPGSTPGSPTYLSPDQMAAQAGDRLAMLSDVQYEYQRLYGQSMPMLPSQLVQEADRMRLDPKTFAERHFKFSEKRQEIADKAKAEETARIAAEAVKPFQEQMAAKEKEFEEKLKANNREWAERTGSNPDVRRGQTSDYATLNRAVRENARPDPLNLNAEQRRMATRNAIQNEVTETVQ